MSAKWASRASEVSTLCFHLAREWCKPFGGEFFWVGPSWSCSEFLWSMMSEYEGESQFRSIKRGDKVAGAVGVKQEAGHYKEQWKEMKGFSLPRQPAGSLWYCSGGHGQHVKILGMHTLKPNTKDFPGAWLARKQLPWLPEWHRHRASSGMWMWRRCSRHCWGTGLWYAFTLPSLSIINL